MMKKLLVIPVISLGVISCASSINVAPPGALESTKYDPVNTQRYEYGKAKYRLSSREQVNKERRKEAYQAMYEACNGKYQIIKETTSFGDGITTIDHQWASRVSTATTRTPSYNTISFDCVATLPVIIEK